MPLLETVIFAHVVQIVASDDDRARHFVLDDDTGEDAAANRHVAGERALLVDVGAFDGLDKLDEVH